MIEKMKMVHIMTARSRKNSMLEGLRELGVVHIAEKKSADRGASDLVFSLTKTAMALKDYAPEKTKDFTEPDILSDEEFEKLNNEVLAALDRKSLLLQKISDAEAEIERIHAWGDFSPADFEKLRANGYDLHIYRLTAKDYEAAKNDESIRMFHLAPIDKHEAVAVVGTLPSSIPGNELILPEKGLCEMQDEIKACNAEIAEIEAALKNAASYEKSYTDQIIKAQNAENFSAAEATTREYYNDFVLISGYIPENTMEAFKTKAAKEGWAWGIDDVDDDDDQIPTKVRYSRISKLIQPVFDILGILPGYREQDISLWFFLFFILFFAMIIGDAGYGLLVLIGTLGFAAKTGKRNDAVFLLTVLSVATIVWGAITGTWFGMESAMNVPFLKALVIPNFANYPQYFGVTATAQQNTIMKFSFSIGAIQMALGSLLSIRKKIAEKNLSWLADLGWVIAIIAMYLLSLYLVIGDNISVTPIFAAIGIAFVMVVLFGGMAPDKTFAQGIKAGLADSFTTFLNTISCFGNVMSYIRLFAVGMAGLAIAQSFNAIGAGFSGPLMVVGIIVVLIGHVLNIIMAFLSVVVHGVRLNVLEFSGQVGLEWTGISYEPFKVNNKIK